MVATPSSSVKAQPESVMHTRMPASAVSLGQATLTVTIHGLAVTTDNTNANKLIDFLLNHFIISLLWVNTLTPQLTNSPENQLRARVAQNLSVQRKRREGQSRDLRSKRQCGTGACE